MALDRAIVGALSHAELVELAVRQSELTDQWQATMAQQQALIAKLEARGRELEERRDRDDPTKRMPGLKPAAPVRRRKAGPRKRREHGFSRVRGAPTERYFVRGRRDRALVDAVLGPDSAGVLVTDFYVAYDHYAGPHQRCWTHLLRDIHTLKDRHPADPTLRAWAEQGRAIYDRAGRVTGTERARRDARRRCEDDLLAACRPFLHARAATVPQATRCRRIAKSLPELFTFVDDPTVPATNYAAERRVRPVVIARKIGGGTRPPTGTSTATRLATRFGTWRARGLDPLAACRRLLAQPLPSPA